MGGKEGHRVGVVGSLSHQHRCRFAKTTEEKGGDYERFREKYRRQ